MKKILSVAIVTLFIFTDINAQSNVIITEINFEDSLDFNRLNKEKCCENSILRDTNIARDGTYSARFELNSNDAIVSGSKRAEIKLKSEPTANIERWFAFSLFLPFGYLNDISDDILAQWHEVPDRNIGETPRSPPISLRTKGNSWVIKILWAANPLNTNKTITGKKYFNIDTISLNRWTDWVFHIKFSYQQDGVLQVWKNGQIVVDYKGPNYYNDQRGPYFKAGIYKPSWIKNRSKILSRVVYIDRIKVGSEKSKFVDMK